MITRTANSDREVSIIAVLRTLLTAVIAMALFGLPTLAARTDPAPDDLTVNASPARSPSFDNHNDNGSGNDNNRNGNSNDNGNDNDSDNDNDENDNRDHGRRHRPPSPPPPPPPPREVSACLSAGQELQLQLPGGNVRVLVFGESVQIALKKIDPSSVPDTPGPRVDALVWEITASACGGGSLSQLPEELNVGVDYLPDAAAGLNQANFTIAVLQGGQWSPSQKQAADPPNTYVSATETHPGVYSVYQR
jgi:hypothetical protein